MVKKSWILVWTLSPSSLATSSKSLSFSDPQFSHLWNEAVKLYDLQGLLERPWRNNSKCFWCWKKEKFLSSCFIRFKVQVLEVSRKASVFLVIECFLRKMWQDPHSLFCSFSYSSSLWKKHICLRHLFPWLFHLLSLHFQSLLHSLFSFLLYFTTQLPS